MGSHWARLTLLASDKLASHNLGQALPLTLEALTLEALTLANPNLAPAGQAWAPTGPTPLPQHQQVGLSQFWPGLTLTLEALTLTLEALTLANPNQAPAGQAWAPTGPASLCQHPTSWPLAFRAGPYPGPRSPNPRRPNPRNPNPS